MIQFAPGANGGATGGVYRTERIGPFGFTLRSERGREAERQRTAEAERAAGQLLKEDGPDTSLFVLRSRLLCVRHSMS